MATGVGAGQGSGARRALRSSWQARAIAAHARLLLDAAGEYCVGVKPQVACFERLGAPGWAALSELVADARERGLIVIADAKRGDIDVTARAYGEAFFGGISDPVRGRSGARCGRVDGQPAARARFTGAVAVAGSRGLRRPAVADPNLEPGCRGRPRPAAVRRRDVSDAIARMVDELGRDGVGDCGLSDVGAVVGATAPEHLERLREAMPAAVMLLPGLGPQGGDGRALAPAFAPGPAGGSCPCRAGSSTPTSSVAAIRPTPRQPRRNGCARCSGTCTRSPCQLAQGAARALSGPVNGAGMIGPMVGRTARLLAPIAIIAVAVVVYLLVHDTVNNSHHTVTLIPRTASGRHQAPSCTAPRASTTWSRSATRSAGSPRDRHSGHATGGVEPEHLAECTADRTAAEAPAMRRAAARVAAALMCVAVAAIAVTGGRARPVAAEARRHLRRAVRAGTGQMLTG